MTADYSGKHISSKIKDKSDEKLPGVCLYVLAPRWTGERLVDCKVDKIDHLTPKRKMMMKARWLPGQDSCQPTHDEGVRQVGQGKQASDVYM